MNCAWTWFMLSDNLFVILGLVFLLGIGSGLGIAPYMPARVKRRMLQ